MKKVVIENADALWQTLKAKNLSRREVSIKCGMDKDYLSNNVTCRGYINKKVADTMKQGYDIDVENLGKEQKEMTDNKYIDLVVCKHDNDFKKYLFQAPPWSHLKANDAVFVDTKKGKQWAKVIAVITVNVDYDQFNFIVNLAGASLPLGKVLQKVTYEDFKYSEGNENE